MNNNPKKRYILLTDIALTKGDKGDTGPQGPAGTGASLPINTSDSIHDGTERTSESLRDIIDDLVYVPVAISSFTTGTLKYEKGTVLTSIGLTWAINKAITSQTITGAYVTPPTLIASQRSATVTLSSANTDFVVVLEVNDGSGNPNALAYLSTQFIAPIYYGKAPIPGAVNSAFLNARTKVLQTGRPYTFSVDLGATEYGWYAIPTTLLSGGEPIFKINGFSASMVKVDTFSHTNASGSTEDYAVYRTEYSELGETIIEVI